MKRHKIKVITLSYFVNTKRLEKDITEIKNKKTLPKTEKGTT